MAILVVATAVLSNFAQGVVPERVGGSAPFFLSGILISNFGGLSGVVFGLFGFIVIKQFNDPRSGFFLPQLTIVLLLGYLVFCMLPVAVPIVGNWAHGIGFLTGVALAYIKN
jgi:GlpG protein